EPPATGTSEDSPGIRGTLAAATRRTATDQRRTGRKSEPPGETEPRSRTQESRNRTCQPRPAREGGAAGVDVEIQIGVSSQYVPRAANSTQQHADPREAIGGKRRPEGKATRIRSNDSHFRFRPVGADQRNPGSLEDRSRNDGGRAWTRHVQRSFRLC